MEKIIPFLQHYLMQYSFLISQGYYMRLWHRYFTVSGFCIGAIVIFLIYNACLRNKDKLVASFLKTLAVVALINRAYIIFDWIRSSLHFPPVPPIYFDSAFNPLAFTILGIVVFSCYKSIGGRAFFLGTITSGITVLLYYASGSGINMDLLSLLIARAILTGVVCTWIVKFKHFHRSYLLLVGYYVLIKFSFPIIYKQYSALQNIHINLQMILSFLASLKPDFIIFVIVFVIAIVYEMAVLTIKRPIATT